MKRRLHWIAYAATVTLSSLPFVALAGESDGKVRPGFKRSALRSPALSRPSGSIVLPRELRLERFAVSATTREAGEKGTPSGPAGESEARRWIRLAELEAHRLADLKIETEGFAAYYRVGFHDGLHAALDDPAVGAADRSAGFRDGAIDHEATVIGFEKGRNAAAAAAATAARRDVRDQFTDLAVEPVSQPLTRPPRFVPDPLEIVQPDLESVFADLPPRGLSAIGARHRRYLANWALDIHEIYRHRERSAVYDHTWADASSACSVWLATSPEARRAVPVAAIERRRFEKLFRVEFERRLASRAPGVLTVAFERGYLDGWAYGAMVHAELHYRRGYVKGFIRAADAAARAAFASEFPVIYERHYRTAFAEWHDNPKPEIGRTHLRDGNDDGVFEPGEALQVELELINYGGAAGEFDVRLEGALLRNPSRSSVYLPARRSIGVEGPLVAFIDERTPPRTHGEVELSLLDHTRTLPLRVAHPLEFERGTPRVLRDDLDGDVRIEVELTNRSRYPQPAIVTLTTSARPGMHRALELAAIGENGRAVVDLDIDGLPPLQLISGGVTLDLEVTSAGTVHDRYSVRLPESATDLNSPALLDLMVRLARDVRASASDIETARELMLRRLEVDWRAAVRASGNPYKSDYRHRSRQTALGNLTRTWLVERSALARPDVFAGLSDEVLLLARELPGIHPFLRKYVRKLAQELP